MKLIMFVFERKIQSLERDSHPCLKHHHHLQQTKLINRLDREMSVGTEEKKNNNAI